MATLLGFMVLGVAGLSVSSVLTAENPKGFELVETIIRERSPKTVDEFLAELKSHQPELFSRFTLMRESKSLQSASPADPRAIVFGPDAEFVISFNGSANQSGYYQIEMMQFVDSAPAGARFELRELSFDPKGRDIPQLSEINPAKCARCHGVDPKPIWESYDNWPGAYGEEDDALIDFDAEERYPPTGANDNKIVERHRQHLREFRSFMATKDTHPRFQLLEFPKNTGSPVAPYIPRIRSGSDPLRPNLLLTKLFAVLNGRKLARQIESAQTQSCSELVSPLLAANLLECAGVDAVSQQMKTWKADLRRLKADSTLKLGLARWDRLNGQDAALEIMQLATMAGVSDFDWSPARVRRQWRYFQGFKDIGDDIVSGLWPSLMVQIPALPEYRQVRAFLYPNYYQSDYYSGENVQPTSEEGGEYGYETNHGYREYLSPRDIACRELVKTVDQSDLIAKIQDLCAPGRVANEVPTQVITMCMSCHDGSAGPQLGLDRVDLKASNPELFKKVQLRIESADENLRMPPGRSLSLREYQGIWNFWK